MGPDEAVYIAAAQTIRNRGIFRGNRKLADRFLADPTAGAYPSPIRWGWNLLSAGLTVQGAAILGAILAVAACIQLGGWAAIAAASAPLLWLLARQRLQDTGVAAAALWAIVAAAQGNPWLLGAALFVGLSFKEASPLAWPAVGLVWLWFGHPWLAPILAGGAALVAWALGSWAILGRDVWQVLGKALRGHDTEYSREHQRGRLHRLFIDLALLSPLYLLLAAWSGGGVLMVGALLIIAAHAMAPIQNIRTVLAADLLVRVAVAGHIIATDSLLGAAAALALLISLDVYVYARIRKLYDPVTANLLGALLR
jgi:hypothetical protein